MENLDSTKNISSWRYPHNMSIKSYAKVNLFLKITGYKDGYHTLLSRFARVDNLYDNLSFVTSKCNKFTIDGFLNLPTQKNLIYKSYKKIEKYLPKRCIDFFREHKIVVDKKIPEGAGLGGGSSNSASFLLLLNRVCDLRFDIDKLAKIGSEVGADVPFFIYNYKVANVKGFGEIVEEFNDIDFKIDIYTPDIHSNTAKVYKNFKENFLDKIDISKFKDWEYQNSKEILDKTTPIEANDLFKSALKLYPELRNYYKDDWYFSGSGSSFFKFKPI